MNFYGFGNESPTIEDKQALQDRDQRVLDLPGAALPAELQLRAARGRPGEDRRDEGRRQPGGAATAVRHRELRRSGRTARIRVRLARPERRDDRAARDGRARCLGGERCPEGQRNPPARRGLLRPEGVGRDRELRRCGRERVGLPRQPEAGVRDPARRPHALGRLPLVRVGEHLRGQRRHRERRQGPRLQRRPLTGAIPRSTATPSCASGWGSERRRFCRCAGA